MNRFIAVDCPLIHVEQGLLLRLGSRSNSRHIRCMRPASARDMTHMRLRSPPLRLPPFEELQCHADKRVPLHRPRVPSAQWTSVTATKSGERASTGRSAHFGVSVRACVCAGAHTPWTHAETRTGTRAGAHESAREADSHRSGGDDRDCQAEVGSCSETAP